LVEPNLARVRRYHRSLALYGWWILMAWWIQDTERTVLSVWICTSPKPQGTSVACSLEPQSARASPTLLPW
jgi:hypothetical protein